MKRLFVFCLLLCAGGLAHAQMGSVDIVNNTACSLDVAVFEENSTACGTATLASFTTLAPSGSVTVNATTGYELTYAAVRENGCSAAGLVLSPGSPSDVCGCTLNYSWNTSGPGCSCSTINGTWQATSCTTSEMDLN